MRGKKAKKRIVQADPVYKSKVVERLIVTVMDSGKKALARKIVYGSIAKLNEDSKEAIKSFELAVKNVMPQQEVRSRRIGGATYQVPMPLKHDRAEALALRWIVRASKSRAGKPMVDRLADELRNAVSGTGDAIKKKEETHRMAEANRAFAHFARY
jgi:small subunit ribosomal protein S7